MQWTDDAFVLGVRRHGESSVILEALTREHGRHLGLVRGGRSRTLQPVLQPGNAVHLTWRARIDEQLGSYAVEGLALHAGRLMGSRLALYAVTHVAALVRLLPERDPHPALHEALGPLFEALADEAAAPALVARLELAMLTELGFGLDLSACAVTGATQDLIYVSPRSGRAVSRAAGAPWSDRLLPLPAFLRGLGEPRAEDVAGAFRLTGFFLQRDVFGPRGLVMPEGRQALVDAAAGGPAR
ncbi:DNA repair protein RecO [Labrys wisconsinensis]|uniref:DNA repair protein RecO n=1 Tax=Labrys wisconsinensis TaxID=425677 RepID=A0ABU0JBF3_9HYPH|nr:DNA repair protein RecO [Labrys wisconsinensis]MDQ0471607.1 DNA repair protein RecO (recombination protein O) [Labrys wisconsinensis]